MVSVLNEELIGAGKIIEGKVGGRELRVNDQEGGGLGTKLVKPGSVEVPGVGVTLNTVGAIAGEGARDAFALGVISAFFVEIGHTLGGGERQCCWLPGNLIHHGIAERL